MEGQKNNLAIAGLVLGILSIVLLFVPIPFSGLIALVCGIVGIIISVKGRKIEYRKGMATAGMVLSIIGLSIIVLAFLCVLCIGSAALGAVGALS